MFKILDLFAGTQSAKKTFPDCDYRGVDIYSPEGENIILDLSQPNIVEKLLEKLGDWKPDFIWASPLCTTFSRATCIPGGTLSYEVVGRDIKIREKFSHITHKAYVKHKDNPEWIKTQQDKGKLGLDLMENTIRIINYFKVPFAIENPANALSKYVLKEYKRTITHYCRYGFPYKKPTAIYSNMELNLLQCNHKKHEQVMSGHKSKTGIENAPSSNKDRSRVPQPLIKEIINQIMKGKNE